MPVTEQKSVRTGKCKTPLHPDPAPPLFLRDSTLTNLLRGSTPPPGQEAFGKRAGLIKMDVCGRDEAETAPRPDSCL